MTLFRHSLLCLRAWLICMMLGGFFGVGHGRALADEAHLAVAANFRPAMQILEAEFERNSGHRLSITYGSTGQFFAQIKLGAPFDLFLAADSRRPHILNDDGENSSEPVATYAIGQLALWAPHAEAMSAEDLTRTNVRFIAIANAQLAPYGAAALEVLEHLGLRDTLERKLVRGNNVGQAFVFAQTENADLGFVALSQILSLPADKRGAYWLPPQALYPPIRQDAMLLKHGEDNQAALAFFTFLFSEKARKIIENSGYRLP